MLMTCYIVDDEPASHKTISSYIARDSRLKLVGAERNFRKARQWLLDEENEMPHIVFLDIEVKESDGRSLAGELKGKTMIVFITGHERYAVSSYEYRAIDYLLKPFDYQRFKNAIDTCADVLKTKLAVRIDAAKEFFVKDALTHASTRIVTSRITYIESRGNYTRIYLRDFTGYRMPKLSLRRLLMIVDTPRIIRIHKSYAINMDSVESFDGAQVCLIGGAKMQVGPEYRQQFRDMLDLHTPG